MIVEESLRQQALLHADVRELGRLATRNLRLHPGYALLDTADLARHPDPAIARLAGNPGVGAVLAPRPGTALSFKAISGETAALIGALDAHGTLASVTDSRAVMPSATALAALVLDGVLEAGTNDGFVSGTAYHPSLFPPREPAPAAGRIAALSRFALMYAQTLRIDAPATMAARLYTYNTIPLSPRRASRLAGDDIVLESLGLGEGGRARRLLEGRFRAAAHPSWHAWHRDTIAVVAPSFKVYVSPHPDDLADVLPTVVEVFTGLGVDSFKLGKGITGLLRPDKLVAYVRDRDRLDEVVSNLEAALRPWRAQGVPFTTPAGESGMVSWAVDPPDDEAVPGREWRESWRSWVTNHLAVSLLQARREATPGVEPWRFAVDRLALEGVDTTNWTPPFGSWLGR